MGLGADGRTGRRAVGLSLLIVLAQPVGPFTRLLAQVAPNRATAYLHPSNVHDARAIWVNPAGLGVLREASVYAELAVAEPGAKGRLRQVNAGFNARGLSFGYQRDIFDDGLRGHTYRLGLGGSSGGLAAGFDVALYRGDGAKASGWDVGAIYSVTAGLSAGLVAANLGQPIVRGLRQRLTFIPGLTWRPFRRSALSLSTHARLTSDSLAALAFGASWEIGTGWPLGIIARLDTDGKLRRGALSLGLSIGGLDRIGTVVSSPGDASRVDAISLYGLSMRQPLRSR